MINVLINGINGRMGQELMKQIAESENLSVICGVDVDETSTDRHSCIFKYSKY